MYIAVVFRSRVVDVMEVADGSTLSPWEIEIPANIPVGTGWLFIDGAFIPPR